MLCVAHISIFHINLWQRIWPTSWNIWNYHWGVKPGLNGIIHKWSYTYRWLPQCFGSEIELMLWWDGDIYMCVLSRFSLVQLCNTMDCRLPGSSVHGIPQAIILEWVGISSSRRSSRPKDQTHISCIGRQILYHWTTRKSLQIQISRQSWANLLPQQSCLHTGFPLSNMIMPYQRLYPAPDFSRWKTWS